MSENRIFLDDEEPSTEAEHTGPPKIADAALSGVAGVIVRKILPHTEAGAPAMLFNLLAGFGSMVGRRAYTAAGNSRHFPNLFGVLVGPTASGRKGTSWSCIESVLNQVDPEWAEKRQASGLSSGEGLIYHVRDERTEKKPIKEGRRIIGYQDEIVDEGTEDKRLFLIEEEFASVLKRIKGKENTLSAIVRSAWDGKNLRNLIKNSPDRATDPHISIAAHITKAEASELLANVDCQNGLANRFLWIYTTRSKFLPNAGMIPIEDLSNEIEFLRKALGNLEEEREILLESDAQELWNETYQELAEGQPGLIGAVTGRAAPQVRRLALIYSLLDGGEIQTKENLESALAFWKYCEHSAQWLFGTPFNHPDADKVFRALKTNGGRMTRSEVNQNVFSNHAKPAQLDEAIEILEKAGAAFRQNEPTGGATREIWILISDAK